MKYIKHRRPILYTNLLTSCKLTAYLADIDEQAEELFFRLVKQLAEKEGVTEQLKADNQMLWGAGLRWRPLPQAEAPTEPTGETANKQYSQPCGRNCQQQIDICIN
ncbi:TnpV protein [Oscillospiraceae bacterium LCP25S3_E10]